MCCDRATVERTLSATKSSPYATKMAHKRTRHVPSRYQDYVATEKRAEPVRSQGMINTVLVSFTTKLLGHLHVDYRYPLNRDS